jgi:hypothetical protein
LRLGYEQLEARAAELRRRLRELEPLAQRPRVRVQLLASLANVQAIETSAAKIATLLGSLEQPTKILENGNQEYRGI